MTPADYTVGFVQRDGNMHNDRRYGEDLQAALERCAERRASSSPHWIHWYVFDADDEERGYFEP